MIVSLEKKAEYYIRRTISEKKLVVITILFIAILLIACDNENSTVTKDWEITEYNKVNNFIDVSMIVKEENISSTNLTVIFKNNYNKQVIYSDDFSLEKKIGEKWFEQPVHIDEHGFKDIDYELPPSGNEELIINWDYLYKRLDTGEYGIIKKVFDFRKTEDNDEYYLAGEFIVD